MNRPPLRRRGGFTLVELLVVIGIIVVLVTILLPTVGKVRIAGSVAATQQQIATIGGAIERYHLEHGAFPGPFPASAYNSSKGVMSPGIPAEGGGSAVELTLAETLVLALAGGIKVDGTALKYDPSLLGKGASSLGPDISRRKRFPAYLDPTAGQMVEPLPAKAANDNQVPGTPPTAATDSDAPEFIDRFQIARPILYARANKGGTGMTQPVGTGTVAQYPAASVNAPVGSFVPYVRGPAPNFKPGEEAADTNFPGDFNFDPSWTKKHFDDMDHYLRHPTIPNTPRRKDSFILVAAGPDRTFGTRDDIFYGQ